MPIIQRSYYDAAEKGRQDAAQAAHNALAMQQGQAQLQQEQRVNALMSDPNATPEQYARQGRTDVAYGIDKFQNSQANTQAEQQKAEATKMVQFAQYGIQSANPKKFVEQNAPQLAQAYGPDWETATDDQVKAGLQDAIGHYGPLAGIGPAPAPVKYETVNGPRGSIIQRNPQTGEQKQVVGPDNSQPSVMGTADPQSVENTAQMIANNQIPMISGYALRSKWGQDVVSRVREINPQFAGADYNSNLAGIKQFTSGKNGNTIRSLNVAVQHLDQLGQLAQALDNGNMPAFNKIAIAYKNQTGQAAPSNFNAAKKVVADEIVKAIVGSGGGVADREQASASINAASSPAQLAGVIETYSGLMAGQLNGIREQYKAATGRDNFESLLLPETRARLEKHSATANTPQTQAPQGAIDMLRANPNLAPAFKAKYGYLPQ